MIDYGQIVVNRYGLDLTTPDKTGWMQGRCPFHEDRHPSFGFNSISGAFNCFRCGHGNFRYFVELMGDTLEEVLADLELDPDGLRKQIGERFDPHNSSNNIDTTNILLSKWAYSNRTELTTDDVMRKFDYMRINNYTEEAIKYAKEILAG